ncbi:type II toxin-antitoxin system VapC family toxin [Anaerolineae bacterium CFX7]|nr:type II toxin-antitoxin system VapC family toxin [Anaerolineae bacterium CFX7]
MSDYLLDTDVLARCLRGVPETLAQTQALTAEGDLHISVWSQLELWLWALPEDRKPTLDFLTPLITHPLNEDIARRAAELMQARGSSKSPLTYAEAVIAATTLHHGLTLVSYSKNLETLAPLRLLSHTQALRGIS